MNSPEHIPHSPTPAEIAEAALNELAVSSHSGQDALLSHESIDPNEDSFVKRREQLFNGARGRIILRAVLGRVSHDTPISQAGALRYLKAKKDSRAAMQAALITRLKAPLQKAPEFAFIDDDELTNEIGS